LAPSRTSPSAVDVASERSLEADDAGVYACYLHDLRQELQEPPEFVLCDEFAHSERLQQITALVADHDGQLHSVVRRRGSRHPEIVDHACKYAWIQLLTAEHVDLRPPRWAALAWVTSCAVRHARMLNAVEGHAAATESPELPVMRLEPVTSGR
jgi:hypothetical protein